MLFELTVRRGKNIAAVAAPACVRGASVVPFRASEKNAANAVLTLPSSGTGACGYEAFLRVNA
jgi:hypothetical protein